RTRVDHARDSVAQVVQHLVSLRLRQAARRDGGVYMLLRLGDERVDEPGDGLAVCLGHLRERLPALELRAELVLADAQLARRRVELPEVAELTVQAAEEGRIVAGVDALLEPIPLGSRHPPRRDGSVDTVA